MRRHDSLKLTAQEIARAFADPKWAEAFPPVLTLDQAADLIQIPKASLYDWSSRGLLDGCAQRVGKHLRIFRDRFIDKIFNEGLHAN